MQLDRGGSLIEHVPEDIRGDDLVKLEANGRWVRQSLTRQPGARPDRLPTPGHGRRRRPAPLDALGRRVEAMDGHPDVALVFGRTRDLAPDGELVEAKNLYPPGRIAPGVWGADWERRGGSCSIVVPTVMGGRPPSDSERGWPASVAGMDVLLLPAVSSESGAAPRSLHVPLPPASRPDAPRRARARGARQVP